MKVKWTYALVMLIVSSFSQADLNPITGKWASEERTKGGLGTLYNFSVDNIMTASFGALVDLNYSIDGKMLKTTFKNPDTGKTEPVSSDAFSIDNNKLVINPTVPEAKQEMARVGPAIAGENSIVGSWSFKHYTGVMATMQYTTDGLAQLSVPMKTLTGHYKLTGHELEIQFQGRPESTRLIRLDGNRLTIVADKNNKEERYIRVSP